MEDLYELLESDNKPFAKQDSKPTTDSGAKKVNLWDKEDFKPLKVDPSTFKKNGKTFTISYNTQGDTLSEENNTRLFELAKVLVAKGYTYRTFFDGKEDINKTILGIEGIKSEAYIPWKKFNLDATNVISNSPTEKAYSIALNSHKVFMKLPPAVRAILANQVKVHLDISKDGLIRRINPNDERCTIKVWSEATEIEYNYRLAKISLKNNCNNIVKSIDEFPRETIIKLDSKIKHLLERYG